MSSNLPKLASLNQKFPKILKTHNADGEDVDFWFECSDGWYEIISSLCYTIQNHVDHSARRQELDQDTFDEEVQVKFTQVKEKFGGLRVHISNGDDYVYGAIAMAEAHSLHVCELCGSPGKLMGRAWRKTRCEPCDQEETKGQGTK